MSNISTRFKLIDHYGDPTLMEEAEVNLKHWLDWSFLEIGAWTNVEADSLGIDGGNFSILYNIEDPNFTDYTVFGGIRKEWVYEADITYRSPEKSIYEIYYDDNLEGLYLTLSSGEYHSFQVGDSIVISNNSIFNGPYVIKSIQDNLFNIDIDYNSDIEIPLNIDPYIIEPSPGVFSLSEDIIELGTGSGGVFYAIHSPGVPQIFNDDVLISDTLYNIDYVNGKVIFNSPVSADNVISAVYSYRNVQVYVDGQMPHNFEIQKDSILPTKIVPDTDGRPTSPDFKNDPSHKIQLPAIIVEAVASRTSTGYELGAGTLKCYQDVLFTIISQNKYELKIITDILANQKHKVIPFYDIDVVVSKNYMPLTYEGYINDEGMSYSEIINDNTLNWSNCFIRNAYVSEVETNSPDIYQNKVRYQLEVIKA